MAGHSRWALVYSAPVLQTDRALPHSLKPFPKLISSWVSVAAELLTCYPFQKYLILKWYPSITVFQAKEEVSNGENSATGAGKETTWACVGLRSCVLCRHLWLVLGTAAAGGISSGAGRSPPASWKCTSPLNTSKSKEKLSASACASGSRAVTCVVRRRVSSYLQSTGLGEWLLQGDGFRRVRDRPSPGLQAPGSSLKRQPMRKNIFRSFAKTQQP